MPTDFDILVDSDAFVGLFLERDAHHAEAVQQFEHFSQSAQRLATTSFVIAETATVLSHYDGQELACRFLDYARSGNLPVIFVSEGYQEAAEHIFIAQANKRTSMVDCSNVAIMQHLHIPKIWSFDAFYFKRMNLSQAA